MVTWILILLLFIVTSILVLRHKRSRYYQLMEQLPSPKRAFLFGNLLLILTRRKDLINNFIKVVEEFRKYPVVCIWLSYFPVVFIFNRKGTEVVLNSSQHIEKSRMYEFLEPWLGKGLLTSTGLQWRSHRKALTPSFHFNILQNFMPIFNEESDILVSKLEKMEGKGTFNIYPFITLYTLDVICATAMGKRMHAQNNPDTDYVKAVSSMSEIVFAKGLKIWLRIAIIFQLSSYGRAQRKCLQILHKFTENVIQERRKDYEANKKKRDMDPDWSNGNIGESDGDAMYGRKRRLAFLDTLFEATVNGRPLTDHEIREEVDTFMFEGHDTTATGISFTILLLGWCPTVQVKLHQELDRIFGGSDRPIMYDDLNEMKYLDFVIKEALRIYPPVPLFGRHLTSELEIEGYTLPAGAEIFLSPPAIHHDADVYPHPFNFDPSRYFKEDWQTRDPYGYIPFSAGPRNCIGQKFAIMEMKVVLSHIFRKFEVVTHSPPEKLHLVAELVVRSLDGIMVSLKARN